MSKNSGSLANRMAGLAEKAKREAGRLANVAGEAAEAALVRAEQAVGAQETYTLDDNIERITAFLRNKKLEEKEKALSNILQNRQNIDFLEMKELYSNLKMGLSDIDLLFKLSNLRKEKELSFVTYFLSENRTALELFKLVDSNKIETSSKLLVANKLEDNLLDGLRIDELVGICKDRSSIEVIGETINDKLINALEKKLNASAIQDSVDLFVLEINKDPKNNFLLNGLEASLAKRADLVAELRTIDSDKLELINANSTNQDIKEKTRNAINILNQAEQEAAKREKERASQKIFTAEQSKKNAINYTDANQAKEYINSLPKSERQNFLMSLVQGRVNGRSSITYEDLKVFVSTLEQAQTPQNFLATILSDSAPDIQKDDFIRGLGKIEGTDLLEVVANVDKETIKLLVEPYQERDSRRDILKKIVLKRDDFSFADYKTSFPEEIKLDSVDIKRDFIELATQMNEARLKQFVSGINREDLIAYVNDKTIESPVVFNILNTLEESKRSDAIKQILPSRVKDMDFEGAKLEAEAFGLKGAEASGIAMNALLSGVDNDKRIEKIRLLASSIKSTDMKIEIISAANLLYEEAIGMVSSDYEKFAVLKNFTEKMKRPEDRLVFIEEKIKSTKELLAIINYGLDDETSKKLALKALKDKESLNISDRLQMEGVSRGEESINSAEAVKIICDHCLSSAEAKKMTPRERLQLGKNLLVAQGMEEKTAEAYFKLQADKAGVLVPRSFTERVGNFVDRIFTSKKTRDERAEALLRNSKNLQPYIVVKIADNKLDGAYEASKKQAVEALRRKTNKELREYVQNLGAISIEDLENGQITKQTEITRDAISTLLAERRGQNLDNLIKQAIENVALERQYGTQSDDLEKVRVHSDEGERLYGLINEVLNSNPNVSDTNLLKRIVNTAILEKNEESLEDTLRISKRLQRTKTAIKEYIANPENQEKQDAMEWEIERVRTLDSEIAKMIKSSEKTEAGLAALIVAIDERYSPEAIRQKEIEARAIKREKLESDLGEVIKNIESYSEEDKNKLNEVNALLSQEFSLRVCKNLIETDRITSDKSIKSDFDQIKRLLTESNYDMNSNQYIEAQNISEKISKEIGLRDVIIKDPLVFEGLCMSSKDPTSYKAAKAQLLRAIEDDLSNVSPKVEKIIDNFSMPEPSRRDTVQSVADSLKNLYGMMARNAVSSAPTTPARSPKGNAAVSKGDMGRN